MTVGIRWSLVRFRVSGVLWEWVVLVPVRGRVVAWEKCSVVGLVVRISAFQADGPGSIPGQRILRKPADPTWIEQIQNRHRKIRTLAGGIQWISSPPPYPLEHSVCVRQRAIPAGIYRT